MGEAGGQHARLARAGACQNQQGTVQRLDRGALLGVQPVEIVPCIGHYARISDESFLVLFFKKEPLASSRKQESASFL
jgi:hypothetical protein